MFGRSTAATDDSPVMPVVQRSPRPYRHKLRTLAYVSLDSGNAAILRDLGQSGLAMQTATALSAGNHVEVRVDLSNPRCHVDGIARVVWTDSTAQAGLRFLSLSDRSERALKEWIFSQLLMDAGRVAGEGELLFSGAPVAPIRLEKPESCTLRSPETEADSPRLRLLGFVIQASRFSRVVDGLVLLCSVLLFSLISLFLIDILPAWWFIAAFLPGVTAVFAGLYWLIFAMWFGTTPGSRLAALATIASVDDAAFQPAKQPRFR
jgi:PilZ domain